MTKKKGASQTIWIVVGIIIALAVALVVITALNTMVKKGQQGAEEPIGTATGTVKVQTCKSACDNCKQLYGGTCKSELWDKIGKECKDIMPDCT